MRVYRTSGEWDVPEEFNFARDVVEAIAEHDRTWPAVRFVDGVGAIRRFTFAEMHGLAMRWAGLLRDHGLQPGDRLITLIGRRPEWHAVLLAALRCGAVSVPCSTQLGPDELTLRIRDSGASFLVAEWSARATVESAIGQLEESLTVVFVEDASERLRDYPREGPCEETYADDIAFILYTSGTARESKGVAHTHAATYAARIQADHWLDARPDDIVWCTADTGWPTSIWNAFLGPWSCGAEILLHEGAFDSHERLELIERLRVTVLCQSPHEYRLLAKVEDIESHDLSRVQHAVSTGELLGVGTITSFRKATGVTIYDGYGQTESAILIANPPGSEIRAGSVGRPTPHHDVAVIDGRGDVVAAGVEGDIAVRGRPPTLFAGYWAAPEETSAAFRGDWYVTGDRASRDHDGYFWLTGRAEDVVVSAGSRISPFDVESTLFQHDAVAEAAVVGKPDRKYGEIIKAFVVAGPEFAPSTELAAELREHCARLTAPHQHLREVEFVERLPKTACGKVRRGELRELEAQRASVRRTSSRAKRLPEPELAPSTGAPGSSTTRGGETPSVEQPTGSNLAARLRAHGRAGDGEQNDPRASFRPTAPLDLHDRRAVRATEKPQAPKGSQEPKEPQEQKGRKDGSARPRRSRDLPGKGRDSDPSGQITDEPSSDRSRSQSP